MPDDKGSLTPEFKWASFGKKMNALTYRPTLKKDLWSKFCLGTKVRTLRQARSRSPSDGLDRHNPESSPKFTADLRPTKFLSSCACLLHLQLFFSPWFLFLKACPQDWVSSELFKREFSTHGMAWTFMKTLLSLTPCLRMCFSVSERTVNRDAIDKSASFLSFWVSLIRLSSIQFCLVLISYKHCQKLRPI